MDEQHQDRRMQRWHHDEQLLAALDRALHPPIEAPESFVRAAQACYTWRHIDAELAALSYDSLLDDTVMATTRAETVPLRSLTFETTGLTFELEVMPDGLAGQIVGPPVTELWLLTADGNTNSIPVADLGYFVVRPVPATPFRLQCRLNERTVITDAINI